MIRPARSEPELWDAWVASRDTGVRDQIAEMHAALVGYYANAMKKNLPGSISIEELVSAGNVGLLRAIDRYEPKRGLSFSTYARQRIRGAMLDWLRELQWPYRYSADRHGADRKWQISMSATTQVRESNRGRCLGDFLTDQRQPDPAASVEAKDVFDRLIDVLDPSEQLVIRLMYRAGMSQVEASRVIGVTFSRVSQMHKGIMTRLRERATELALS